MNYDLSIKENRKRFVKRANYLLKKSRTNVMLIDESQRTVEQNSYLHVLCRILAQETGVSEEYAKDIYFKREANPNIFNSTMKDPVTGKVISFVRSTTELSIPEMSRAIDGFHKWAADWGFILPEAKLDDDGNLTFASDKDRQAFHQAQIETSKLDEFGNNTSYE